MQVAIELPDELGKQLLQHTDIQQFVQEAVKTMLLDELRKQAVQQLTASMSSVPTSVSLADELIAERRIETEREQRENRL